MNERILTLHPEGKQGVRIDRTKYDAIRRLIVDELAQNGELSFRQLRERLEKRLVGDFSGSVSWYCTTVKLDLEARGVIQRVAGGGPQRLKLVSNE